TQSSAPLGAPPGGDVLDDEEALARPDQPDAAGGLHERRTVRRRGQLLLERAVLRGELRDLGRARTQLPARVEIRVHGPVVQEPDHDQAGDPEPAGADAAAKANGPAAGHGPFRVRGRPGASSYASSTLITFVEPGMFTDMPAVITTMSPASTRPVARAASIERTQR